MGSNTEVVELRLRKKTSPGQWVRRTNAFVLLLGFALFSLNGWLRMIGSISYWYWLTAASISPGPLYLLITGLLWGAAGLIAFAWIALRRPHYPVVGTAVAVFYALSYWVDRIFIRNQENSVNNTVFAIAFTLLALVFVVGVLRPFPEKQTITQ